ncbi:MAG: hypothetical protein Q4C00_03710, partial [Bacillota bacterium]|nr:hypothetical protein [Bacillota bacterium]
MEVELLDSALEKIPQYKELFTAAGSRCEVIGCCDEVRLMLSVHMALSQDRPLLYVAPGEDRAKAIYKEARRFFPRDMTGYYHPGEILPYDSFAENSDQVQERVRIMEGLGSGRAFFAVTAGRTLGQAIIPPDDWQGLRFTLKVGDIIDISRIAERLAELGYVRESLTEEPGTFSVRGSIVDFYPVNGSQPYRLDFFDDEIESIRIFDRESQISTDTVESITVTPAAQFIITSERLKPGLARFKAEAQEQISNTRTQT